MADKQVIYYYIIVIKNVGLCGEGSVDFFAMIINSMVIEIDEDKFLKSLKYGSLHS
jgi:hypothetical protein